MRREIPQLMARAVLIATTVLVPAWATAQDNGTAAAMERARQAYQIDLQRQAIETNRAGVIADLMNRWSSEIGTTERGLAGFQTAFLSSSAEKLFDLTQAQSWESVVSTMLGLKDSHTLGSASSDLVFNPVTPCRVMDSRFGTGPYAGPFSSPSVVSLYVTDPLTGSGRNQGGEANCGFPFAAGTGVALNFTVVPVSGSGDLKVYPFAGPVPNSSIINFSAGQNLANAASTSIALANMTNDLSINIEFATSVHIIVDIMGYYSAPAATALDVITVQNAVGTSVPNLGSFVFDSPACPAGRTLTGGGFNYAGAFSGVQWWTSAPNAGGTAWQVGGYNTTGGSISVIAFARCARVPGR